MKKLLSQFIFIVGFVATAHAETDTFNMSLTGDVSKDFCIFEMGAAQEFDIDVSMVEPNEPVVVKRQYIYLDCSPGEYNIYIATTESEGDIDIGGGMSATFSAGYGGRFLIGSFGHQTWPDKLTSSTPYSTEGIEFRYSNSWAGFMIEETLIPISGDWSTVADTFSNSVPFVVTIENVPQ
tara:strand:+ start:5699 stop:6238 length:540 start_codon:yes stop_codon:yes gene_type:complete